MQLVQRGQNDYLRRACLAGEAMFGTTQCEYHDQEIDQENPWHRIDS
jgi:hypothetical protein